MLPLDVCILKTPILLVLVYTPSPISASLSGMLLVEPSTPIWLHFLDINLSAGFFIISKKTISTVFFWEFYFPLFLIVCYHFPSSPSPLPSLPLCPIPFFYFYWFRHRKYCISLLCLGSTPRTVFCMGTIYRLNQCAHFLTFIYPLDYYFLVFILILS